MIERSRNPPENHVCLGFAVMQSAALPVDARFRAHVLDTSPPVGPEVIETQAVLPVIDLIDQTMLQDCPLRRVYDAFENGILHPLAEVFTSLGHPIEATRAAGVFCATS